jgi:hypothetical protein
VINQTVADQARRPGLAPPKETVQKAAWDPAPTRRDLLTICLAALLIRALLCVLALHIRGWSALQFAMLRDGDSYIRVARALLGDPSTLRLIDRRVFIGYPALIASVAWLGVPVHVAALGLNWVATAISAILTAITFRDRRLGWAMATLTPSYLLYSTMAMSEATLLALTLGGIVIVRRHRNALGGALLGAAGLIRPMACFAALGVLFERSQKSWRSARTVAIAAACATGIGLLLYHLWSGNALESVEIYATNERAYAGQLFTWPFESLIMTPIRSGVAAWRVAYIWSYVVVTFVACWIVLRDLMRRGSRSERPLADLRLNAPWLVGNTVFTLFIGHIWGFYQFHRFILVALPPLLWLFQDYYPKRWHGWLVVGSVSFALALVGILHSDIARPG